MAYSRLNPPEQREQKSDLSAREQAFRNRRQEPRMLAQGDVRIRLADGTVLLARLVDRSVHGFHIVLYATGLKAGQQVRLVHCGREVDARVVWTQSERGCIVEAGLFLDAGSSGASHLAGM